MLKIIDSKTIEVQKVDISLDSSCDANALRDIVRSFDFSRHYSEKSENLKAHFMITDLMAKSGGVNCVVFNECYNSIECKWNHSSNGLVIAGGTHYDTVKNCPGADDNTSGIAVLVCAARFLNNNKHRLKATPHFYFFNREEDGLLGSCKYVDLMIGSDYKKPSEVHIMEMVGYTSENQTTPQGLPNLGNKGDFLGIVGNGIAKKTIQKIGATVPELHSKGFDVPLELNAIMSDLLRSDHAPFWMAGIPTTMWTDTSNFRNPNYHMPSDTYDTLDYNFMENVVKSFVSLFL